MCIFTLSDLSVSHGRTDGPMDQIYRQYKASYTSFVFIRTSNFFLRLSVLISTAIWGSNCSWNVLIFPIASLYRNVLLSGYLTLIANWMDMKTKILIIKKIKFQCKSDWSQLLWLINSINSFLLILLIQF